MRKGFLHIIEIIIIALVMFVIIIQFTNVPGIPLNFDKTRLELTGTDILFTLNAKGVNWLNRSEVKEEMETLLNKTNIVYDLNIKNAIKTPILIGCICDDAEFSFMESVLTPFMFNGEEITFVLFQLRNPDPAADPGFKQNDVTLPLLYDVIVSFDYDLAGEYVQGEPFDYAGSLQKYLKGGKGFVQIRDLGEQKLNLSERRGKIQKYFFGTVYDQLLTSTSQDIRFTTDTNHTFYREEKYFHHLPFSYEGFEDLVADDWVPYNSTWGITATSGSNMYQAVSTSPIPGFNNFTAQLPENYTVTFDMIPDSTCGIFWSPSYRNQYEFISAGENGTSVVIGNRTLRSGYYYNMSLVTVSDNEQHRLSVTKRGDRIEVLLRENDGYFAETQYDFGEIGGIPPGDQGLVTYCTPDTFYVDNFRFTVPSPFTFQNFISAAEKIKVSDNYTDFTEQNAILREGGNGIPALVMNQEFLVPSDINNPNTFLSSPVFLQGRIAWLSSGAKDLENRALIRSVIIWASGDEYQVLSHTIPNPSVVTFFKAINIDMFQPLEIVMNLGFVF